jgi:phosphotransferase system IIB component
MPCFTRVSIEVKDQAAAKAAAEKLKKDHGWESKITKLPNGMYKVEPKEQYPGFEKLFKNEYAASLATAKAKQAGYTVVRMNNGNEIQLTLRQY